MTISPPPSLIRKAVVPAAGLGARLRPLTLAIPKELLPIGRKPVLAYVADELRASGVSDALFIVSPRKPQIRAFFGDEYGGEDDNLPPLRCHYLTQIEQKGAGDAVLLAEAWVGDAPFVVAFGDCLLDVEPPGSPAAPLMRLIAARHAQQAVAAVLVETVPQEHVTRYGVLAPEIGLTGPFTAPFAARDIVEKPSPDAAPSNLVAAARYAFNPAIFAYLRASVTDERGERNITDPIRAARQAGGALWAVPLQPGERRRDIGNLENFLTAFVEAALRDREFGPAVRAAAQTGLASDKTD